MSTGESNGTGAQPGAPDFVVAPRKRASSLAPEPAVVPPREPPAAKPAQKCQLEGWSDGVGLRMKGAEGAEGADADKGARDEGRPQAPTPRHAQSEPQTPRPPKQGKQQGQQGKQQGQQGKQQQQQGKQQGQQGKQQQGKQQGQQQQQQQGQGQQQGKQGTKEKASPVVYGTLHSVFTHLPQYSRVRGDLGSVPATIARIGTQMAELALVGSNARCVAMLRGFTEVFEMLTVAPEANNTQMQQLLLQTVNKMVSFLVASRPLAVSMGCAINYVKNRIRFLTSPERTVGSFEELCRTLCQDIHSFIEQRVQVPARLIVRNGAENITAGDTVVTFGLSSVVSNTLLEAHMRGKRFHTVVVDSAPAYEGRELLQRLTDAGMECSYTLLSGTSYALRKATKVILGAHAMLCNGVMMGRSGTALVATAAHAARVPVIACCESYKFLDRAQLDSIELNQLGNPEPVLSHSAAADFYLKPAAHRPDSQMTVLNPLYDMTPIDYITAVRCEFGIIPATSVPVIVREFRQDQIEQISFEDESTA